MRPQGRVVVDTNVFSYMLTENALGLQYTALLCDCKLCVSFVTPEESYYGVNRKGWGDRRRQELEKRLADCVLLPVNLEIARISGRIRAERGRRGRPLSLADSWIAATALWYELPAVSHDADLLGIDGLVVIRCCASTAEKSVDSNSPPSDPNPYEALPPAYFCNSSPAYVSTSPIHS